MNVYLAEQVKSVLYVPPEKRITKILTRLANKHIKEKDNAPDF